MGARAMSWVDRIGWVHPALRMAVLCAGRWTCVACGAETRLCQVDHFRPRHADGLAIIENLAPLCPDCNAIKSCYWPDHGYHQRQSAYNNPALAADIHEAELRWLIKQHGRPVIIARIWGAEGGEPGPWAYRRLEDGYPKWLADWHPRVA